MNRERRNKLWELAPAALRVLQAKLDERDRAGLPDNRKWADIRRRAAWLNLFITRGPAHD